MTFRALLLCAALVVTAGAAVAENDATGTLQIANPWVRATPRGANVAGGYMTITNKGAAADRLVGGSTPVANRFEIHQMTMEQGVMKMRPVEGGLEIKPGQTVELKPGSFHVMLVGLKQPLQQGQRVKGTLVFQTAGKMDVEFTVESMGAMTPGSAGHTGH